MTLTHPPPSAAELERAYGDWYRPITGRYTGFGDLLLLGGRRLAARRIDVSAAAGPILDIGAGAGTMLAEWERRGRDVRGVERAEGQTVPLAPEGSGGWAAIVFWHSLEHLPQPGAALDDAADALAIDGIVVVAVPNHDSLQAAAFGERWLHLDLPRHLSHPAAEILIARLEQARLRVTRVSRLHGGQILFGWLHGLTGALPGTADLHQAIRRPGAREDPAAISSARRFATLAAATLLLPAAAIMAAVEIMLGRPGTIYVEARRG